MNRRELLLTLTGTSLIVAGCLQDEPAQPANEYGYQTLEVNGVDVPLAPVIDVYDWYGDEELLILDTRSESEYTELHIEGAAYSPAPDGLGEEDPIHDVEPDTKIVTYCVCPHSLATSRGAETIRQGYRHTYALDEGLQGWVDQGYPVTGTAVQG